MRTKESKITNKRLNLEAGKSTLKPTLPTDLSSPAKPSTETNEYKYIKQHKLATPVWRHKSDWIYGYLKRGLLLEE